MPTKDLVRTHVALPRELLEELDRHVGPRRRSEKLAELLDEWLQRERRLAAFDAFVGSMDPNEYPEWSTPERSAEWVRRQRSEPDRDVWAERE